MKNQIQWLDINELTPYEKNPRDNTKAIKRVADSIREFGFNQPIVVDKDNVVVVGHTRLKASKMLKLTSVPVLYMDDDVDDAKIKAYRIADNKLNEYASWDESLLGSELSDLFNELDDIEMTGFDKDEAQSILDKMLLSEEEKENMIPPLKEYAKTVNGDIWVCGDHRVLCGSSLDPANWELLLEGRNINCCFTSPPYNMGGSAGNGLYDEYNDNKGSEEYIQFNSDIIDALKPYLKGFLFYNISYNLKSRWEFIDVLADIKTKLKFLELIVWRKKVSMPPGLSNDILKRDYEDIGMYSSEDAYEDIDWIVLLGSEKQQGYVKKTNKKISNVWEIDPSGSQEENHRAAFPVDLPWRGIKMTTRKNEVVADPFGGTGTTMIAAEKGDRSSVIIELSPVYTDMIVERWQAYTGKQAVRLSDGKLYDEVENDASSTFEATFDLDRMDISDAIK